MLPVTFYARDLGRLRRRILLGSRLRRLQDDHQTPDREISTNALEIHRCPFRFVIAIFAGASSTRVSTAIQFTSQVLPPSSENACSKRHEFGVMSEMTNRTRIARPFSVSWS